MASRYECEVRFLISDIQGFRVRLETLGAETLYPYEFTDHYYRPLRGKPWDPSLKTLRIREWKLPKPGKELRSEILLTKTELVKEKGIFFKRSLYPQGKLKLMEGDLKQCEEVLRDMGFEKWFEIEKKRCRLFKVPAYGFNTIQEYIEGIGWTGELEVEGADPRKAAEDLTNYLRILSIKEKSVTHKSLARIYGETKGLILEDQAFQT